MELIYGQQRIHQPIQSRFQKSPLNFCCPCICKRCKNILGENQINKTELDLDKLIFLIDKAKAYLDNTLPDLRQFLSKGEK